MVGSRRIAEKKITESDCCIIRKESEMAGKKGRKEGGKGVFQFEFWEKSI